jgi:predicted DNA-binding protein with PD1-like motif
MLKRQQKISRVSWLCLKQGDDLLKAVSAYCLKNNVKAGLVMAIGALQKAAFSYYEQKEKKFCRRCIDQPVEIVSCLGNVSLKNGKPFLHAHLAVADSQGKVFGGHLEEGCIVFAADCAIFETKGDIIAREFDENTGLFLLDSS